MDEKQLLQKARTDLYYFSNRIVGLSKMSPVPHQELCDHLLKPGKRKKLNLLPRNSFKSSIVTVAGSLFRIINNPNIRILIASETQKNSIKYVREIRSHLEENERILALFGAFQGRTNWREYEFTVSKRTAPKKEPTVMASSLEKGTIVGMHFDLIILDDVVSINNINSPEQIQKTLDYYRLLQSILDPEGELWINGTRWSIEDLYGWIIENEHDKFDIMVKKAIDENGTLLMPKVLSLPFLEEQKKTQGEAIFSCQYLNNPITGENATFRAEDVRFYDPTENPKGLYYFMTVDPAISLHLRSDYTGLVVNGVDYHNHWWIQEALEVKLEPSDLIDLIFKFARKYPLQGLGMEKFALEKFFKILLIDEMEKRNFFIPLQEVPTNTRHSKETRIRALQPKLEAGEIHIKREHAALYHQLLYHPQLKHDDVVDALKTQLQIAYAADKPADAAPENYAKLTQKERQVWDHVKELGSSRKVRRTKWISL